MSTVELEIFGRTDVGRVREHNEDNFVVADLTLKTRTLRARDRHQRVGEGGTILGVCDGMGGAAAGEVASQIAIDTIYEELSASGPPEQPERLAIRLVRAVEHAGARIFGEARSNRARMGMGTTATIAAILGRQLFVAQVGDSRCYVLRNGELRLVTRDQSLVNQLIEAGQLTEEEAETFEHNNIILQALGTTDSVQVDLTHAELFRGDVILLCSDGLSGMVRADEIRRILVENAAPFDACRELTDRANAAGGHDNVTVIVARVEGDDVPEPAPDQRPPAYEKLALAETTGASIWAEKTPLPEPPAADAAEVPRSSRRLKVGHTMVAMEAPTELAALVPGARHSSASEGGRGPEKVPVSGISPLMMAMLVAAVILVVAVAGGYYALTH